MTVNFKQANIGNFKWGRSEAVKYIVVHYTANDGDTAKNNADYYARESIKASAHYFVDENEIWQSVKESDTAYHCGANIYKHKECRNSNSIGIELCSRQYKDGSYYFKEETLNKAQKFVKQLMKKYNIPPENIVRHFDVTGKICPAPMVNDEKAWGNFKSKLTEKIESANDIDYALKWKYGITFENEENEKEFIKELNTAKEQDSKLYWIYYKLVNN